MQVQPRLCAPSYKQNASKLQQQEKFLKRTVAKLQHKSAWK